MKHCASPAFWKYYNELPEEIKHLADKNFILLKNNPEHPSLHLKNRQNCTDRHKIQGSWNNIRRQYHMVLDWNSF